MPSIISRIPNLITPVVYGFAGLIPRKEGVCGTVQGVVFGSFLIGFVVFVAVMEYRMRVLGFSDLPVSTYGLVAAFALTAFLSAWYHLRRHRFMRDARIYLGTPDRRRRSKVRGYLFFVGMMLPFVVRFFENL